MSKIAKYHPEVLDNLEELIVKLPAKSETQNRITLENENYKAIVRKDFDKQKENWVLTAFEKKESIASRRTDPISSPKGEAERTTSADTLDYSSIKESQKQGIKNLSQQEKTYTKEEMDKVLGEIQILNQNIDEIREQQLNDFNMMKNFDTKEKMEKEKQLDKRMAELIKKKYALKYIHGDKLSQFYKNLNKTSNIEYETDYSKERLLKDFKREFYEYVSDYRLIENFDIDNYKGADIIGNFRQQAGSQNGKLPTFSEDSNQNLFNETLNTDNNDIISQGVKNGRDDREFDHARVHSVAKEGGLHAAPWGFGALMSRNSR